MKKRRIRRISPDGEVIYNSLAEAAEANFVTKQSISKAAHGWTTTCAGYFWRYIEETIRDIKVTTPGGLVFFYENQVEAAKANGISPNTVHVALRYGRGVAEIKGYHFEKLKAVEE